MKYDVLLFDLDDTLFSFNEAEKNALDQTFQSFELPNGLEMYRESYKAISKVLWNDLEMGRISISNLKSERFRRLFLEHELDIDPERFGEMYIDNLGKEVHMIDGVLEMLDRVSKCRLAVLTNGFTDVQNERIGSSVLHDTFEVIITSEETGTQKPDPKIFEYTFNALNITDTSRVLMIGDSLSSDIQGGNNFGIDTCWFNRDKKENTTTVQPTYEISSWDEFNPNSPEFLTTSSMNSLKKVEI
ncbi:YjjG family noncanonical pyrimidine nucleotidase [Sporosarcina sp. CAU 1771]